MKKLKEKLITKLIFRTFLKSIEIMTEKQIDQQLQGLKFQMQERNHLIKKLS